MRIGSLFSGTGGLDLALEEWFGATTAWVSDVDKGASTILATRFPDAPNLGDITAINWGRVEPVDIIAGGSPCQDVSSAGKRAGMTAGTRSNLWVAMREAVAQLRPRLVVWENVRGAYSAAADSDLEPCPGCVGDNDDGPVLRALGRVLGDLAALGYDTEWVGLRAADIGACHGRYRVFVVAHAPGDPWWQLHRDSLAAADAPHIGYERRWGAWPGRTRPQDGSGEVVALPTPPTRDHKGHKQRSDASCLTGALLPTPTLDDAGNTTRASGSFQSLTRSVSLLPTPAVNDMGDGKTLEWWDEWTAAKKAKHGNGNGHGPSLAIEAQRLLPTPRTENNENRQSEDRYGPNLGMVLGTTPGYATRFRQYADAIARHTAMLGRPAPNPTEPGPKGNPRLSARFVEWMQCHPDGWVTDLVSRTDALKALGNTVVPPQAYEALNRCADVARASERAAA